MIEKNLFMAHQSIVAGSWCAFSDFRRYSRQEFVFRRGAIVESPIRYSLWPKWAFL
jgi:hypothetical protein